MAVVIVIVMVIEWTSYTNPGQTYHVTNFL